MDYFVDVESFAIPFKMNSSLLSSHLTVFGNILVSLQIILYQVYIEIICDYCVSHSITRDYWRWFFFKLLSVTSQL